MRVSWPGVITRLSVAPATAHEHSVLPEADLTNKKKDFLQPFLLRRYPNGEIAEQLSSSCNTVENRITSVVQKPGVRESARDSEGEPFGPKVRRK